MRPLAVLFLWHMHQPSYMDGVNNQYRVPWVRLHAARGYYDMLSVLRRFENVKVTFNLAPCLLAQLKDYAERGLDTPETYLQHSLKPADSLTEQEIEFVLTNFFHANWDTMIRPHSGYNRLLEKRGLRLTPEAVENAKRNFTHQDITDLQVWFNLAWCGFMSQRDIPGLAELKIKGMGFTDADRHTVLKAHIELIRRSLERYAQAADEGRIEISASPMYHPILPLLMDTDFANRGDPQRRLPDRFSAPEDAAQQIERGLELHREIMGIRPAGMWPSEGSVCPELIPLLNDAGLRWIATDEEVLRLSLRTSEPRNRYLYRPYRLRFAGREVKAVFRNHELSDLIGFTYSKNPAKASADDFIARLMRIALDSANNEDPRCVAVVLDGENPWEYFPAGGEEFLESLYEQLDGNDRIRAMGISDYLDTYQDPPVIDNLHSGSWINANYNIWIGGPESNQGWELLGRTRTDLVHENNLGSAATRQKLERAWDMLYQAEGSDWFWWFDDDFTSEMDEEFDALFRSKLAGVYLALGEPVPNVLDKPIARVEEAGRLVEPPLDFISPTIDGKVTHFYEWENAGFINLGKVRGSMHLSKNVLANVFYGFDLNNFYLRLDPAVDFDPSEDIEARLLVEGPQSYIASFPLKFGRSLTSYKLKPLTGGKPQQMRLIAGADIIEMVVPFAELNYHVDESFQVSLRLYKGEIEQDCYPRQGSITIDVPDRSFRNLMWSC